MKDDYREVPLLLAVSLGLWTAGVAAGLGAGVFSRLHDGAFLALAAFAAAYAPAAVLADARLGGWLAARGRASAIVAGVGLVVLLWASAMGLASGQPIRPSAAPWAPLALLALPVTLAAAVAVFRAARPAGALPAREAAPAAGDRFRSPA